MEERKLTCIGCPMGCPLTVVMNGKEVVRDLSYKDRDLYCTCIRGQHSYGISKNKRGYS